MNIENFLYKSGKNAILSAQEYAMIYPFLITLDDFENPKDYQAYVMYYLHDKKEKLTENQLILIESIVESKTLRMKEVTRILNEKADKAER